jgi:hypothetical protein
MVEVKILLSEKACWFGEKLASENRVRFEAYLSELMTGFLEHEEEMVPDESGN